MNNKYSEDIVRYRAVNADGKPCEILERITFERESGADGQPGERREVARRYDLRTGERLNRLSDTEFEDDESGDRLFLKA